MRNLIIAFVIAGISLVLVVGATVAAEKAPSKVAVWVEIPRPSEATDERLTAGFENALPTYAAIPGLERKYFTMSSKAFGGVFMRRGTLRNRYCCALPETGFPSYVVSNRRHLSP